MAVDVYYSDNNFVGMISPRLSFSRDLEDTNNGSTAESISSNGYICAFESTFDFAFNVDDSVAFASTTSADELFSDGKIIPTRLKTEEQPNVLKQQQTVRPCLDVQSTTVSEGRKKSLKEFLADGEDEAEPNNGFVPKSFWKFRRSNSLNNCDRNQRKGGLIGSWKILSRSGSTGKFLEKIVEEEKPTYYNFHQKILSKFSRNNSLNNSISSENAVITNSNNKGLNRSSSKKAALRRSHSTSEHYFAKSDSNSDPNHFRRSHSTGSALKKQQSQKQQHNNKVKDNNNSNFRGYYGNNQHYSSSNNSNSNSLKVNPMLNLPSPYISRVSVDLLGFGLFCNGSSNRDRKKRK